MVIIFSVFPNWFIIAKNYVPINILLYQIFIPPAFHWHQVNSILASVVDLKDPMSYYIDTEENSFWVAVSGSEVAGSVGVRSLSEGVAEIKRMQVWAGNRYS